MLFRSFSKKWNYFLKENANLNSAHVVLVKDNQILLLKRASNDAWMPDHYAFPGGKFEKGEDALDAICRECKEETNLDIDKNNIVFLNTISNELGHKFYLAKNFSGDLKLNNEHSDFKWVNPKELSSFKTVPDVIIVAKAALEVF